MRIAFDFDGTLCVNGKLPDKMWSLIQFHMELGDEVIVVTSRNLDHENHAWWSVHEPDRIPVWKFIEDNCLSILAAIFTCHNPKGPICAKNGVDVLYDNDPLEIESCKGCGVEGVLVHHEPD